MIRELNGPGSVEFGILGEKQQQAQEQPQEGPSPEQWGL